MTVTGAPEPDVDLAARLFDTLRTNTFDGIGITRASYGEGEQFGHDLIAGAARDLGLELPPELSRFRPRQL